MICPSCSQAADVGNLEHGEAKCDCPESCTCQHGFNLECDPDESDGHFAGYLDALPADDPRRLAYEARIGRKIPS